MSCLHAQSERADWHLSATSECLLQEAAEQALDDLDVGRRLGWKKCTDRIEELREPTEDDTPEALLGRLVAAGHYMSHCQAVRERPGAREVHLPRPCFDEARSETFGVLGLPELGASVSRSSAAANAVMASRTN